MEEQQFIELIHSLEITVSLFGSYMMLGFLLGIVIGLLIGLVLKQMRNLDEHHKLEKWRLTLDEKDLKDHIKNQKLYKEYCER